jgi:hypothetical protein
MSDQPIPQVDPSVPAIRCINLMCKAMMVYGEAFESDPDYQAGMTDWWCQCTQKPQGPDCDEVAMQPCSDRERSCYRAY